MSGWILIHEIPLLDLSQISHSCCALMRDLAEIQFSNLIIKIHSLTGFCLKIIAKYTNILNLSTQSNATKRNLDLSKGGNKDWNYFIKGKPGNWFQRCTTNKDKLFINKGLHTWIWYILLNHGVIGKMKWKLEISPLHVIVLSISIKH